MLDMQTNPDFNYRSLNRKDLMSLSVIKNEDTTLKKFKQLDTKRDWSTNNYNLDIEGSAPKRFGMLSHKIDYINKVDDIERSKPKELHFQLKKPEFNLTNKDIEGSSPQCVKFKTIRTDFNPLEPNYKLPKIEEFTPIIPKFIRDSISVDGIDGAQPKKYFKWETRKSFNSLEVNSPKKYYRNTRYNNIDYSDVTHDFFKTKRSVNPLDPIYEVNYKDGENYVHGVIEGSKPAIYPNLIYKEPFNLRTSDIEGTQVGSKNRISQFSSPNSNLKLDDIPGTSSGSLKKGILTQRETNPLDPDYKFPGHVELGKKSNPYGDTLFSISTKQKLVIPIENIRTVNENKQMEYKIEKDNMNLSSKTMDIQQERKKNIHSNNEKFINNSTKILMPSQIVGDNSNIYLNEPVEFDSEKYKKPHPFYGFIHDKYLIANDDKNSKLLNKKTSEIQNVLQNNRLNVENGRNELRNSNSGSIAKTSNNVDFYKNSYAQMLDKFIVGGI